MPGGPGHWEPGLASAGIPAFKIGAMGAMVGDFFTGFGAGRLGRRRFAVLALVLYAIGALAILASAAVILPGIVHAASGTAGAVADAAIYAVVGLGLALAFAGTVAQLNIVAKRARDIGLYGWLTACVVTMVGLAAPFAVEAALLGDVVAHPLADVAALVAAFVGPAALIVLALVPTGAAGRAPTIVD